MGRADPGHLAVGHVVRAHGILGEIFVSTMTDHPEGSFAPGVVLRPGDAAGLAPDPDLPPLRVAAVRPFKDGVLVTFGGVETRSQAEAFRGRYLFRPTAELERPAPGEFWHHELRGLEVVTAGGDRVGVVRDVVEVAGSDLLAVDGLGREHLIPFRKEFIVEVDLDAGRIVVDPPEGLLDL